MAPLLRLEVLRAETLPGACSRRWARTMGTMRHRRRGSGTHLECDAGQVGDHGVVDDDTGLSQSVRTMKAKVNAQRLTGAKMTKGLAK
jgi:hypothetical protein